MSEGGLFLTAVEMDVLMSEDGVREWARDQLDDLGLSEWTFDIVPAEKFPSMSEWAVDGSIGMCIPEEHTIVLAREFVTENGADEWGSFTTANTVLHECAHALTLNTDGGGHGEAWEAKFREIGGDPDEDV
jgi:hypothetical protein